MPFLAFVGADAAPAFSTAPSAPPAVPAARRPDVNAFVDHKVRTTAELLREIKTNPHVADRYQRHFSMNKQEVLEYMGTLHPGRLTQSGVYTIYSVPDDGRVKMHRGILRKGEPLFFNPKGQPILVVKCGNPLVLNPRPPLLFRPLTPQPNLLEEPARDDLALRDGDLADVGDLLALEPSLPAVVVPTAAAVPGALALGAVPASAIGASSVLPYLGLAPVLIPIIRGGGGITITPVPEPTALAPLAIGLVYLVRRRRK